MHQACLHEVLGAGLAYFLGGGEDNRGFGSLEPCKVCDICLTILGLATPYPCSKSSLICWEPLLLVLSDLCV